MSTQNVIDPLSVENAVLREENAALRQRVDNLEEKVLVLLQRLEGKPVKKDSHNSHTPPQPGQSQEDEKPAGQE